MDRWSMMVTVWCEDTLTVYAVIRPRYSAGGDQVAMSKLGSRGDGVTLKFLGLLGSAKENFIDLGYYIIFMRVIIWLMDTQMTFTQNKRTNL